MSSLTTQTSEHKIDYQCTVTKTSSTGSSSQHTNTQPLTQPLNPNIKNKTDSNFTVNAYNTHAFSPPNTKISEAYIETKDLKILGNAFIERDYFAGKSFHVKFNCEDYPKRLQSRIGKMALKSCVGEINLIFSEVKGWGY